MTLLEIGDRIAKVLAAHDDAVDRYDDARERGYSATRPDFPIAEIERLAAEWRKARTQ
jgi:hypothetical protein